MESMEPTELKIKADNLVRCRRCYPNDLEFDLSNELVHLTSFAKEYAKDKDQSYEKFLYQLILEKNLESSFCNAEIALRIYLSMMVTNCSGERSFSKLKIIKNRLRSTMHQERLCNLILMSSESDILRQMDFDDIVNTFANKKSRKTYCS